MPFFNEFIFYSFFPMLVSPKVNFKCLRLEIYYKPYNKCLKLDSLKYSKSMYYKFNIKYFKLLINCIMH